MAKIHGNVYKFTLSNWKIQPNLNCVIEKMGKWSSRRREIIVESGKIAEEEKTK